MRCLLRLAQYGEGGIAVVAPASACTLKRAPQYCRTCHRIVRSSVGTRPALLFLLGSISAFAQPFAVGIKAGVPLTDFLTTTENGGYTASTQRYIVGGVAELRLPLGFGVEFDALYRRLHYDGSGPYAIPVANTKSRFMCLPPPVRPSPAIGSFRCY